MFNKALNHKHYQNQAYIQLLQALLPIMPMALGFTLHITIVLSIYKICIKKNLTIIDAIKVITDSKWMDGPPYEKRIWKLKRI